jgi:hypothetical protein
MSERNGNVLIVNFCPAKDYEKTSTTIIVIASNNVCKKDVKRP